MLRPALIFAISAMFLGLGLGRFAFSPLIPELVGKGWLDVAAAQAIGAANLVGYFVGALLAKSALRFTSERTLCGLSGALVVFSYGMFLLPFGMGWFWVARFLAGAGGALLMVVATAAAGRQLVMLDRKQLQPMVFLGIGLGALFAALCLPQLLSYGIAASIVALMIFSGVALGALCMNSGFLSRDRIQEASSGQRMSSIGWPISLILLAYGCDALGFVMHTVYLPDMLRRAYGHTEGQVGMSWAFFGIGACLGPAFVMLLRRVLSALNALWVAFALKAAGVMLVLLASDPFTASLSLFIVGMLTPGIVILTSGALSSSSSPERYFGLWAGGTALFALCQMISGMVIAAISGEGYGIALILSVAALLLGAAFAFTAKLLSRQQEPR